MAALSSLNGGYFETILTKSVQRFLSYDRTGKQTDKQRLQLKKIFN